MSTSFRRTHAAEVIAAGRPSYGIELSAQADLAACICHSTGAASKRDQRSETAPARRQVDGAGIGPEDLIPLFRVMTL
jgi:hypothetical protein